MFFHAVSLPSSWDAADFLKRLNGEMLRLEPRQPARAYPGLPPLAPAESREIKIGRYPSDGTPTPQDALMAWAPVRTFSGADKVRVRLLINLIGGGATKILRESWGKRRKL